MFSQSTSWPQIRRNCAKLCKNRCESLENSQMIWNNVPMYISKSKCYKMSTLSIYCSIVLAKIGVDKAENGSRKALKTGTRWKAPMVILSCAREKTRDNWSGDDDPCVFASLLLSGGTRSRGKTETFRLRESAAGDERSGILPRKDLHFVLCRPLGHHLDRL